MRSVFLIVALTLTARSGKPLLLGGGGRTPDEVEMVPV
jgi:hypothetical protein